MVNTDINKPLFTMSRFMDDQDAMINYYCKYAATPDIQHLQSISSSDQTKRSRQSTEQPSYQNNFCITHTKQSSNPVTYCEQTIQSSCRLISSEKNSQSNQQRRVSSILSQPFSHAFGKLPSCVIKEKLRTLAFRHIQQTSQQSGSQKASSNGPEQGVVISTNHLGTVNDTQRKNVSGKESSVICDANHKDGDGVTKNTRIFEQLIRAKTSLLHRKPPMYRTRLPQASQNINPRRSTPSQCSVTPQSKVQAHTELPQTNQNIRNERFLGNGDRSQERMPETEFNTRNNGLVGSNQVNSIGQYHESYYINNNVQNHKDDQVRDIVQYQTLQQSQYPNWNSIPHNNSEGCQISHVSMQSATSEEIGYSNGIQEQVMYWTNRHAPMQSCDQPSIQTCNQEPLQSFSQRSIQQTTIQPDKQSNACQNAENITVNAGLQFRNNPNKSSVNTRQILHNSCLNSQGMLSRTHRIHQESQMNQELNIVRSPHSANTVHTPNKANALPLLNNALTVHQTNNTNIVQQRSNANIVHQTNNRNNLPNNASADHHGSYRNIVHPPNNANIVNPLNNANNRHQPNNSNIIHRPNNSNTVQLPNNANMLHQLNNENTAHPPYSSNMIHQINNTGNVNSPNNAIQSSLSHRHLTDCVYSASVSPDYTVHRQNPINQHQGNQNSVLHSNNVAISDNVPYSVPPPNNVERRHIVPNAVPPSDIVPNIHNVPNSVLPTNNVGDSDINRGRINVPGVMTDAVVQEEQSFHINNDISHAHSNSTQMSGNHSALYTNQHSTDFTNTYFTSAHARMNQRQQNNDNQSRVTLCRETFSFENRRNTETWGVYNGGSMRESSLQHNGDMDIHEGMPSHLTQWIKEHYHPQHLREPYMSRMGGKRFRPTVVFSSSKELMYGDRAVQRPFSEYLSNLCNQIVQKNDNNGNQINSNSRPAEAAGIRSQVMLPLFNSNRQTHLRDHCNRFPNTDMSGQPMTTLMLKNSVEQPQTLPWNNQFAQPHTFPPVNSATQQQTTVQLLNALKTKVQNTKRRRCTENNKLKKTRLSKKSRNPGASSTAPTHNSVNTNVIQECSSKEKCAQGEQNRTESQRSTRQNQTESQNSTTQDSSQKQSDSELQQKANALSSMEDENTPIDLSRNHSKFSTNCTESQELSKNQTSSENLSGHQQNIEPLASTNESQSKHKSCEKPLILQQNTEQSAHITESQKLTKRKACEKPLTLQENIEQSAQITELQKLTKRKSSLNQTRNQQNKSNKHNSTDVENIQINFDCVNKFVVSTDTEMNATSTKSGNSNQKEIDSSYRNTTEQYSKRENPNNKQLSDGKFRSTSENRHSEKTGQTVRHKPRGRPVNATHSCADDRLKHRKLAKDDQKHTNETKNTNKNESGSVDVVKQQNGGIAFNNIPGSNCGTGKSHTLERDLNSYASSTPLYTTTVSQLQASSGLNVTKNLPTNNVARKLTYSKEGNQNEHSKTHIKSSERRISNEGKCSLEGKTNGNITSGESVDKDQNIFRTERLQIEASKRLPEKKKKKRRSSESPGETHKNDIQGCNIAQKQKHSTDRKRAWDDSSESADKIVMKLIKSAENRYSLAPSDKELSPEKPRSCSVGGHFISGRPELLFQSILLQN